MNSSSGNGSSSPLEWYNIATPDLFYVSCFALLSDMLVGLPTNSWVLWLIMRGPRDVLSSEIFILNLAVLEVAYCLHIPLFFLNWFIWNDAISKPLWFFDGFIFVGRPLFQSCICVERYLAVLRPITFLRYKPLRYRLGCLGVVWTIIFGGCLTYTFIPFQVINYVQLVCMVIFLSVMSFCCLAVLEALKRPGPGEGQLRGAGQQREADPHQSKRRAFMIIVVNLVCNFITYLPLMAIAPLLDHIPKGVFYFIFTICFAVSNFCSFIQPVHFLIRAGKLQCILGY